MQFFSAASGVGLGRATRLRPSLLGALACQDGPGATSGVKITTYLELFCLDIAIAPDLLKAVPVDFHHGHWELVPSPLSPKGKNDCSVDTTPSARGNLDRLHN